MTTPNAEDTVWLRSPPGISLQTEPPQRILKRKIRLPDKARGMGIFCCATRGTGKSRMLGRVIAWHDFRREVPLVVLDPVGGTIDNLLDKIGREPLAVRRELWKRIRYINMNGQDGRVVPWPIYSETTAGEEFSVKSQRLVDLIARLDPALRKAPILGFNALEPIAQASGIVLCALGLGVTELPDLIADPLTWEPRLRALEQSHPETAPAVQELRTLGRLPPKERQSRIAALTSKLSLVRFHPNFRAIFGASTPAINWQEVFDHKLAVLIDFRDVRSPEHQKFCLLWLYNSFLTYIKARGHGQMDEPVSFMIDELTYLVGTAAVNDDLLTADINELVNRIARSHGVWLTLATQELFQLPEQIRQTVLSMGTVIFGQTSDSLSAEDLAERYYRFDPHLVKKAETRWQTVKDYSLWRAPPEVVGVQRTTEYTRNEQTYLRSRIFLDLEPYHFLIGQSSREGELPTTLRPFTTEHVDANEYPDRNTTDDLRSQLMRRDGIKEARILTEIANRLSDPGQPPPPLPGTGLHPAQPGSDWHPAQLPRQEEADRPKGLPPTKPKRRRRPMKPHDKPDADPPTS